MEELQQNNPELYNQLYPYVNNVISNIPQGFQFTDEWIENMTDMIMNQSGMMDDMDDEDNTRFPDGFGGYGRRPRRRGRRGNFVRLLLLAALFGRRPYPYYRISLLLLINIKMNSIYDIYSL